MTPTFDQPLREEGCSIWRYSGCRGFAVEPVFAVSPLTGFHPGERGRQ